MIGKIGSRWSLVVRSSIIRKLNFVSKRWKGKNSPGFFWQHHLFLISLIFHLFDVGNYTFKNFFFLVHLIKLCFRHVSKPAVPNLFLLAYHQAEKKKTSVPTNEFLKVCVWHFQTVNIKSMKIWGIPWDFSRTPGGFAYPRLVTARLNCSHLVIMTTCPKWLPQIFIILLFVPFFKWLLFNNDITVTFWDPWGVGCLHFWK